MPEGRPSTALTASVWTDHEVLRGTWNCGGGRPLEVLVDQTDSDGPPGTEIMGNCLAPSRRPACSAIRKYCPIWARERATDDPLGNARALALASKVHPVARSCSTLEGRWLGGR